MDTIKYIKSFSKGQITIPKEFRDLFGLVNDFWLKLYIADGKIIVEPVIDEKKKNQDSYLQILKGAHSAKPDIASTICVALKIFNTLTS